MTASAPPIRRNGRATSTTKAPSFSAVVNVASVPQRSPFRYPGGKTWLVPIIRQWLRRPVAELVEPFAGGGIVSLTAAFEGLAKKVTMVERDPNVASVWQVVLNGQAEWMAAKIQAFSLTAENVRRVLDQDPKELRERGFQTLLRNRVSRGGILAEGAGLHKLGENGKGLASRWYPETLARRILEINKQKDKITFIEGDAFDIIARHAKKKNVAFFIDPPYTLAAKRLYTFGELDHTKLFEAVASVNGNFLMTYDNTDEIRKLARRFNFKTKAIAMKNTHHAEMTELLIARDFAWLAG